MKLFEIPEAIELLLAEEVDRETGEITEDTLAKLEELEMAFDDKALAVAAYLKGEKAEAEAVQRQADLLSKRAKAHNNRAKSLLGYLEHYLPDGRELSDSTSQIKWRKSTTVVIEDEDVIPSDCITVKLTETPDKNRIKKLIKDGKEVPGCRLANHNRMSVK
jgi:hypothetical protein